MKAVKLAAEVVDHRLDLQLPEDIDEGPVEIIVLVPDGGRASRRAKGWTVDEFLSRPRVDSRYIQSKEQIDDYLRQERGSWE